MVPAIIYHCNAVPVVKSRMHLGTFEALCPENQIVIALRIVV